MTIAGSLTSICKEILSSLGEPAMQAVFWELHVADIPTAPNEFDIRKFNRALQEIFGDGSEIFMNDIYVRFRDEVGSKYFDHKNIVEIDNKKIPSVEKILQVMSLKVAA